MRVSKIIGVLLLLFGAACQAAVVSGPGYGEPMGMAGDRAPDPGGPGSAGGSPEDVFVTEVLPLLDLRCASCHTDVTVAPVWMERGDERASMLAYPNLVVPGYPTRSVLLTYGGHEGPAWPRDEAVVIADWITLEGGAPPADAPPVGGPVTPPATGALESVAVPIAAGGNVVPLDGAGAEGAELAFDAQEVALGIHLSDVVLRASDRGLALEHPLLVTWMDGAPAADRYDRFAGVEITVPPNGEVSLSTAILLTDYAPGALISIRFDAVDAL